MIKTDVVNPNLKGGEKDIMTKDLYTLKETAEMLRLSTSKLYKMVEAREIGHIKNSGKLTFKAKHLNDYLRMHEVKPVSSTLDQEMIKNANR
jgi:excisionase family DNA binding protein